jgi:O-Antigen ligase
VLVVTMYFTFGRAAWVALAVGVLVAVAADPRRMQLLVTLVALAPAAALAVFLCSREPALTHPGRSLAVAAHDGHRLGLALLALAAMNAVIAAILALAETRVHVGRRVSRAFGVAVALAAAATAAGAFARYGGPVHMVDRAYRSFKVPVTPSGDLNRRLLSLSGNGRAQMWQLAWDDAAQHPLIGAGAGTYERYFLAHEPANFSNVRDAHSLYMETLAELGPVGLALVAVLLLTPLAALGRARKHPLVPVAAGAYVAYLVHTGVDWDWELPAVTLVGLLCGVAILLNGRAGGNPLSPSTSARRGLVGGAVAAAMFALLGLVGNAALSKSETARENGNAVAAATEARRARWLMPWSPAPWDALGRAQLASDLLHDARRSFRKAITIDRGDWHLWYDLAGASTGAQRARALHEVVALYPRSGVGGTR